ncbi:efflux RND transporter periplasmic adaptor subunit [Pseudobythopirellula maris]|uniref:efflux RND transporter periplasmic adaptor subunit n=1 Tax=Pseudobythopirellula maris TaxID=2527991 RepID=UPI0018D42332|nr:efflux RND transporter periplasmic adaptor subunit [Pseudobythopirellula maris]
MSDLSLGVRASNAHEGHAALPTKGLTVSGDQLLLSEGARKAIDLQTGKVTLADMTRRVECNAHVEAPWRMQAMVTTQVPGRIARLFVRPGDRVEAGQELASVESLELEALQLAMLQADAELRLEEEKLARQRPLAERGVITGSAALETEASVRQRTTELEVVQCKLRALGLSQGLLARVRQSQQPVTEFALVSPLSGVVAEADVRVGQVVKTTEHLFHVVDPSRVWVVGDVLEGESAAVLPGQPAVVRFKELPDQQFTGVVDHLHLKMDETRRTRHVAVLISNTDGLLSPGMFGQMWVETARSEEAIVCPTDGIIRYLGSEYVLVNRGEGKYVRKPVEIGLRREDQVEILDGLFPGDRVVVNGNHVLFSLFANETPTSSGSRTPPKMEAHPEVPASGGAAPKPVVIQGTVELPTDRKALASARLEGRVGRILVNHSQPVKAGQVLAEVESLQLRNLQGELLESQSKLAWTRERAGRLERLASQNLLSKKELWQLQTDQRVLENRVASLARRLGMLGVGQDEVDRVLSVDLSSQDCDVALVRSVSIRAAIDGEVAAFGIVPGQIVDADTPLFEIHDRSTLWVKGYVFQRDAAGVTTGQPVSVTFHALPGVRVEGRVVRVSPVLDASERVLPVWVEVDNSDGRLIEGMLARIEINRVEVAEARRHRLDNAR